MINYKKMIEEISSLVGKDAFTAKSLANGSVRINATSVDDFQKIIAGLRDKNTHYFTYQLKTERALKVVIRNLHHSLEPKDIKDALEADGYKGPTLYTGEPRILFLYSLLIWNQQMKVKTFIS